MAKEIQIDLGGEPRLLNVGRFWFTKFMGEATGSDPIILSELSRPDKQFEFVLNMVYAGLRCQYKIESKPEDFTKADVENWIGNLEDDQVTDLLHKYGEAVNKPKEPGEAQTQAVNS